MDQRGKREFRGSKWQPPSPNFDCILPFPNTTFPSHLWYTNMVRMPMLVSIELEPMLRSICTAFRHGMQARPMRCFRYWRLPMGFWGVAWLLFCFLVAGCALLDIFMAAAGDAILPAKTPRPCSKVPPNSRTRRCRADHHRLAGPAARRAKNPSANASIGSIALGVLAYHVSMVNKCCAALA